MSNDSPDNPSADYEAMKEYWSLAADIMGGAKRMRAAKEKYLPRFEKESDSEYDNRVETAPFTNLYGDALKNLASKPFSEILGLEEGADPSFMDLEPDIDRAGNSLHVFARDVFKNGIKNGLDWIFVDKASVPGARSRADEAAAGARPYWVRVPAPSMLAVYSDVVDGETLIVHARFLEEKTVRDGFGERKITRVRVLERQPIIDDQGKTTGYTPARFGLWEEQEDPETKKKVWVEIQNGDIGIGTIALVPFITGESQGGRFRIKPPLADLADMQVTEFQLESNRRRVQDLTAFPIITLGGVTKPTDGNGQIALGPRAVLYFPPIGETGAFGKAERIEPSGASADSLRKDLAEHRREMREAGMQPLVPQSGNLTATATAVAESKAQSAAQAWALDLKDALEQAWAFTAAWLSLDPESAPSVSVFTDFGVGEDSAEHMTVVRDLQRDGGISMKARVDEAKRRSILGPNYDYEADKEQIIQEVPGDDDFTSEESGAI